MSNFFWIHTERQAQVTSPLSPASNSLAIDSGISLFERLGTHCLDSNFNMASRRAIDWSNLVNAQLNTLPRHTSNADAFMGADTNEYLTSAMNATGLIPVNVEGKGDCFFLAFWYGYSGGEVASFEECLELRRMVARVFLSKCESDPDLVCTLRHHYSDQSSLQLSDDAFIEDLFRKLGNFAKDRYPEYIHEFGIYYLSEALRVNIWVWQVTSSGKMRVLAFGDVDTNAPAVHVLNGRDHYFAFSSELATPTSVPLDCELRKF